MHISPTQQSPRQGKLANLPTQLFQGLHLVGFSRHRQTANSLPEDLGIPTFPIGTQGALSVLDPADSRDPP